MDFHFGIVFLSCGARQKSIFSWFVSDLLLYQSISPELVFSLQKFQTFGNCRVTVVLFGIWLDLYFGIVLMTLVPEKIWILELFLIHQNDVCWNTDCIVAQQELSTFNNNYQCALIPQNKKLKKDDIVRNNEQESFRDGTPVETNAVYKLFRWQLRVR